MNSALIRIVQVESDARLRAAAVSALGEVGGEAAFPVLIGVLEDRNPQVRRTGMEALVRLGDPRAGERLAAILRQGGAYDRLGAAAALEAFPAHTPALIRALGDEVAQVRRAAELALVRQAEPGAIPMLVKVLSGPDEGQGERAMRVLANYKGEESRKSLLEVLRRGPPQGASLAALALGLRGEPESRRELEQALVDSHYPEAVSIAVVSALEDLNQPASLPLLKRLAKTASSQTLRTAAGQAAAIIEGR
jgi:HEAT repeat protein